MFFLSGTEIHGTGIYWALNIVCHTLRWVYDMCSIIQSWQSPSKVDILSAFHRQVWVSELLTQRHGATMWWSWSENRNLSTVSGGWAHRAFIWITNLSWREACGFFLWSFPVSTCSGFPIKVVAGHQQQGECYKNRVWCKWTVSASFLLEEPQARHKGQ